MGAAVEVAYQPGQPAVSALETGLTRHSFVNVVMGLFLGAAGTYMAWLVGHHELFQPPGVRPFLLFLPALLWFGMFFGFLYWSSLS